MENVLSPMVGNDLTFEVNEFGKARLCEELETVKNALLTVLFMKPGQYPSLPQLGLNIQNLLYMFYDDIDEKELEQNIVSQCAALSLYFQQGDISVKKMKYKNMPSLIIRIKSSTADTHSQQRLLKSNKERGKAFYIGLSVDEMQNMLVNINGIRS